MIRFCEPEGRCVYDFNAPNDPAPVLPDPLPDQALQFCEPCLGGCDGRVLMQPR